eukprot:scaffold1817_cov250-Pinguiococcus_pyrenoidosus.AAC.13
MTPIVLVGMGGRFVVLRQLARLVSFVQEHAVDQQPAPTYEVPKDDVAQQQSFLVPGRGLVKKATPNAVRACFVALIFQNQWNGERHGILLAGGCESCGRRSGWTLLPSTKQAMADPGDRSQATWRLKRRRSQRGSHAFQTAQKANDHPEALPGEKAVVAERSFFAASVNRKAAETHRVVEDTDA